MSLPRFEESSEKFDMSKVCEFWQMHAQRSTILFLVSCAYHEVSQRRVKVSHMLDHSAFCVDSEQVDISDEIFEKIKTKVNEYVHSNQSLKCIVANKSDLINYFSAIGYNDKVNNLKKMDSDSIQCVLFNNYLDLTYDSQLIRDLSKIGNYELQYENPGFFVRFPRLLNNGKIVDWRGAPLQHRIICDYVKWASGLRSNSVELLNEIIESHQINNIDDESSAFSRHEVSEIASHLIELFPKQRLVTIAGPSSSGKTMFSNVIREELLKKGYDSLPFAMDNYYLDVADTPKDENGNYDFESIYALHIDMYVKHIFQLLNGEEIPKRVFNFPKGIGYDSDEKLRLPEKAFLIIEGINGLNPVLIEKLGGQLTKIFIYPMTSITIDSEHIFRPSDLLLLRRIIRDFCERDYPARRVIGWWPRISEGEAKNITPNLRQCNLFYNSSLLYELPALASVAIPILENSQNVIDERKNNDNSDYGDHDPNTKAAIESETNRLLTLLKLFLQIRPNEIPTKSCIYKIINDVAVKTNI